MRCVHCDEEIVFEPNVGYVEARSGDDGGAYDFCAASADRKHEPDRYTASVELAAQASQVLGVQLKVHDSGWIAVPDQLVRRLLAAGTTPLDGS